MTHFQIFPQIFLAVCCIWYFLRSSCDVSAVVVILTQLLSVSGNFVKLASLSKEFSVMIMEKNRSVHNFDSLHWLPSAPCNLCCDKLKARYFALDKSALFQRLVWYRGVIVRELYWKFDLSFEEKKNYSIFL